MNDIIIRKYKPEDEHFINDPRGYNREKVFVAEVNNIVTGYMFLDISPGNCQVYIYINPEYRRRGIGTSLCHEAERMCREKNEYEFWSYYYDELVKGFVDKLGFYFTTSSIDAEYRGDFIPEQKRDMIRKCRIEDDERCSYIWNKGMHDMRLRVGYPESRIYETTEEDRKNFIDNLDDHFVLEENGKIVGYGIVCGDWIGALAVVEEAMNKGYGTALAIFMTNEILRRGHKTARSCYEAKNADSRHIHLKIGYIETATCYNSFKKI